MTTHAKLTKLSTLPGAAIDPKGARGVGPIEDAYTVFGYYTDAPTIGLPFRMVRYQSNDVEMLGFFITSPVEAFERVDDAIVFRTENSTYQLTPL